MLAFHNDQLLKDFVLDQLVTHRAADKLIKGSYWQDGKGCAVGCTLESVRLRNGKFPDGIEHGKHALYESELGIPIILARLEDRIFEGLPAADSQQWPERFTSAIHPGADLAMVWPRFAFWLMTKEVPQHTKRKQSLASLAEVGALYREWINGVKPDRHRWVSARKTAAAAADAAAYAAYAAAAYAADAAADAAAAAYAADAAAAAAAAAAAYADAYKRQADKLIKILQATHV